MTFLKKDMSFIHYRWKEENEFAEAIEGVEPSRKTFDPHNGHQVLFVINCCSAATGTFNLQLARRMESKIAHTLPESLKSERSVFNWLMQTIDQES